MDDATVGRHGLQDALDAQSDITDAGTVGSLTVMMAVIWVATSTWILWLDEPPSVWLQFIALLLWFGSLTSEVVGLWAASKVWDRRQRALRADAASDETAAPVA